MTYEDALAAIIALEPRGWRMGLDRMEAFCARANLVGHLGPNFPSYIHVAGTNGKGSTTAFVQSLLIAAGKCTGSFFSPYVLDYRERIQLNGEMISRDALAETTQRLMPIAEAMSNTQYGGITKFEFETALGFQFWADQKCDWVALEVGLGGRLDSTNVVTPKCSIIVSIGLDHVNVLGHTYAEIAAEKAGVIKPGVPVVVGSMNPEALEVIQAKAASCHSPIWRIGMEIVVKDRGDSFDVKTPAGTWTGLVPGIQGSKQAQNMALALAALTAAGLELTPETASLGVLAASAPGRFQTLSVRGRDVVLDGAHNGEAAEVLAETLTKVFPGRKIHLVTNLVEGHSIARFIQPLKQLVNRVEVVPIDFYRAYPVDVAVEEINKEGLEVRGHPTLRDGISRTFESSGNAVIVVTGSNYLLAGALDCLESL